MTENLLPESWVQIKDVVWKNGKPWAISVIKYEPLAGASEWKDISMQEYLCAEWSASFPNAVEHKPVSTITCEMVATPAPVSGEVGEAIELINKTLMNGVLSIPTNKVCKDAIETLITAAKTAAPGFTRDELVAVFEKVLARKFDWEDVTDDILNALIDMGAVRVREDK